MDNKKIKQLAQLSVRERKLSKKTLDFILKSMKRSELKVFLAFYKDELKKERVYATSSSELQSDSLSKLKSIFKNKKIILTIDKSVGAGIKIEHADTIADFTFKRYINDTIDILK